MKVTVLVYNTKLITQLSHPNTLKINDVQRHKNSVESLFVEFILFFKFIKFIKFQIISRVNLLQQQDEQDQRNGIHF